MPKQIVNNRSKLKQLFVIPSSFADRATLILFVVIIITFIITRFYNLDNRFLFDHDQEQAANAAWKIIVDKKPMLIGQETSVGGLFVGPFTWWFQSIFMAMVDMNPLMLGYLGGAISFVTLVTLYFIAKDIFDKKAALISAILYTLSTRIIFNDFSSNQLTFIMLFSLMIFWASVKVFVENKTKYLFLLILFVSLSFHVHIALLLFIPSIIFLYIFYRPKIKITYALYSIIVFIVPLIPFAIFEFRHSFLITSNLLQFTSQQGTFSLSKIISIFSIQADLVAETILIKSQFNLLLFILLIISSFIIIKSKSKKLLTVILTLIFLPLFILWLYNGPIPEYYLLPTLLLFIILTGIILSKILEKWALIAIIILLTLIINHINNLEFSNKGAIPFSLKHKIVNYILSTTGSEKFNLYYQMPPGLDTGYRYLFKWKRREPEDYAKNLYIIEFEDPTTFKLDNYYKSYPSNHIEAKLLGSFLHVIAIK